MVQCDRIAAIRGIEGFACTCLCSSQDIYCRSRLDRGWRWPIIEAVNWHRIAVRPDGHPVESERRCKLGKLQRILPGSELRSFWSVFFFSAENSPALLEAGMRCNC